MNFAFAGVLGRKLEEVWRGGVHADGKRTEIVERGYLDLARVHGIENTGQKAEADAVAEFGELETLITNLVEHHTAVGVAVRVPAG